MKMFHISLKLVCGLGIVRSEESIHNSVCLLSLLPQAVSESGAGRVTCTMFQVTGTPAEQVQIADLHVIQGYISGTWEKDKNFFCSWINFASNLMVLSSYWMHVSCPHTNLPSTSTIPFHLTTRGEFPKWGSPRNLEPLNKVCSSDTKVNSSHNLRPTALSSVLFLVFSHPIVLQNCRSFRITVAAILNETEMEGKRDRDGGREKEK